MKVRVLAISIASLLIASCSMADKAGAAALVGESKISSKTVTTQVQEVRAQIESTPVELLQDLPTLTALSQMVIDRLVLEEILKVAVVEKNISVTNAQVATYRDSVFETYGKDAVTAQLASRNGLADKYVDQFMRDILEQIAIMEQLAPTATQDEQSMALYKYLSEVATQLGVEVSPRYGVWNPETMQTTMAENYLSTTLQQTN